MISILGLTVFQSLLFAANTIIDSIMTAHLGEAQIAAMGASTTFIAIIFNILDALASVSSGKIATEYFINRESKNIKKVFMINLFTGFFISAIFIWIFFASKSMILKSFGDFTEVSKAASSYLSIMIFGTFLFGIKALMISLARSTNRMKQVLYSATVNLLSNILLNIIFINYLSLGIIGSAIATLISDFITIAFIAISIREYLKILREDTVIKFKDWFSYMKVALPFAVFAMLSSTSIMLVQNAFGRIDRDSLTSFGVVLTFDILIFSIFRGLSSGTIVVISKAIKNSREEAYKKAKKILKLSFFISVFIAIIIVIFSRSVISLVFNVDNETLRSSYILTIIYSLFLMIQGTTAILRNGILNLSGNTLYVMITSLIVDWILTLPIIYSAIYLNVNMFWLFIIYNAFDIITNAIMFKKFNSKKWLDNL